MAFEEIYLRRRDTLPEDFTYLINIGYKNIFGGPMTENPCTYQKDKERNAFLIGLAKSNMNYHGENDTAYVLCINGMPIGIRVDARAYRTSTDEMVMKWDVKEIQYPENWNFENSKDFKQILVDAFTAETIEFYGTTKDVRIDFVYQIEID